MDWWKPAFHYSKSERSEVLLPIRFRGSLPAVPFKLKILLQLLFIDALLS
jgi:hypothetical protein